MLLCKEHREPVQLVLLPGAACPSAGHDHRGTTTTTEGYTRQHMPPERLLQGCRADAAATQ